MTVLPALTVRELIERLQQCDPNATVISTLWNGWTDTYCAIDSVHEFTYDELSNDFFGTPGEMDDRVTCCKSENVVCISSLFDYNETVTHDKHHNQKEGLRYWDKSES